MFCENCGAQLQDGTKFCPKCGTGVGEGQQAGEQPESQQRTGGETAEKAGRVIQENASGNASKPRKLMKKAAASTKRKALIGAGAGIGVLGIILLLVFVFSQKSGNSDISYAYYDNGTACFERYSGTDGVVTIPSEVKHGSKTYLVTSIGTGAFRVLNWESSSLAKVEIPDSVTSIGDDAFSGCSSLTRLEIPDSVTSIGRSAFSGCSSLTRLEIPDSVTSIGDDAFSGCSSLTRIEIPDSVTSIGMSAFSGCSSLTSVKIPDSVTSIGNYTFSGCSSLTSIEIPDSVTSIGICAFKNCSSLTSIKIPDSVTSIRSHAFEDCSSLTRVEIAGIPEEIARDLFDLIHYPDSIIIAGVEVPYSKIKYNEWKEYLEGKTPESSGGYTREDFVSDRAWQDYLDFGDTSGLKN